MKRVLLVDIRGLQGAGAAVRGIGQHCHAMLRAAPAELRRDFEIVGLVDPAMPPPDAGALDGLDAVRADPYDASRRPGIFLNPAPMFFSAAPLRRVLGSPLLRRAAVVLDFIPHDFPRLYLADPRVRRAYYQRLAALRRYHAFLAISRPVARRLDALLAGRGADATVTGVAVRDALIPRAAPPGFAARDSLLVVAGDDPRKNPEVAVRAHGASLALGAAGLALAIAGIHEPAARLRLAGLHRAAGGDPALLRFLPRMADGELAEAYARARLVIAPSRAEGFSLPIVEALANGAPVLASDDPAQAELIADPADRFGPDDSGRLGAALERCALDPACWSATLARQAPVWRNFTEAAVAARFWEPIAAFAEMRPPFVARGARPRIAFLSPLPPTPSGCADHSAALLAELARRAEITAFSDTRDPILPGGVGFGGRADPPVMRSPKFDAIVAVLGNSPFHVTETRLLLEYGAAAILHDARLIDLYRSCFGEGRARGVAAAELGRDVTQAELEAWTRDQAAMPVRLLGEVADAASPLIVHARETQQFIAAHHGIAARFLPFAPYRLPDPASLTPAGRAAARARLGTGPEPRLIASFGHIHGDKEPQQLIEAFAALGSAHASRFALVGSGNPTLIAGLREQAVSLGIDLAIDADQVPEPVYRDYLAAADVAVQLRRAPPGSISGALMDAIAAGIPSVAAATLAEAIEPPGYVRVVPDDADAGTISTAIGRALEQDRAGIAEARADFLERRGMGRYASLLIEAVLS